MKSLSRLAALPTAAAVLLLGLVPPAQARALDPKIRAELVHWGACMGYIAIFEETLDGQAGTPEEAAMLARAQAGEKRLMAYYAESDVRLPADESEAMKNEAIGPILKRIQASDGRPDRAAALREEFRGDLEACLTEIDALPVEGA